jgi:hypothetical protein
MAQAHEMVRCEAIPLLTQSLNAIHRSAYLKHELASEMARLAQTMSVNRLR